MRILITGGSGFIGSSVVRQAIGCGHEVINIDALTYASRLGNVNEFSKNPNYTFIHADVRERKRVFEVMADYEPNAVLHLAAESHVDNSITSPSDFISTNVVGTFEMLEAARIFWQRRKNPDGFRFLHVSTDEVYGTLDTNLNNKFTEDTPYDPSSPYSASKASSDHLVRAWYKTYGLPTIITNCSNNYGPYQLPEKLIPKVIISALIEQPIQIYGNGNNIRDWLYVEDHADALLKVLEKAEPGSAYNIGGENEITNLELVYSVCAIIDKLKPRKNGKYSDLITFVADRPGHDFRYAIDPTRIRSELDWRPSTILENALEETVVWYLENDNWWRPYSL